jgi:hypothetical protein
MQTMDVYGTAMAGQSRAGGNQQRMQYISNRGNANQGRTPMWGAGAAGPAGVGGMSPAVLQQIPALLALQQVCTAFDGVFVPFLDSHPAVWADMTWNGSHWKHV